MTDSELVQRIANGDTASEIATKTGFSKRTIEKRIEILKHRTLSNNIVRLACVYLDKGLIKMEYTNT